MTTQEKLKLLESLVNDSISNFASMAESQKSSIQSDIPDETISGIKADVNAIMQESDIEKSIGKEVSDIKSESSDGCGNIKSESSDGWNDIKSESSDGWGNISSDSLDLEMDEEDEVVIPQVTESKVKVNNDKKDEGKASSFSQSRGYEETKKAFYPEDFTKAVMQSLSICSKYYNNKTATRKLEEERKKPTVPKQCSENYYYKKNTIELNGKPFEYKVLKKEVNWGKAFTKSFALDDKLTNLEKLNEKIMEDIKLTFGDLNRITDVAVVSGMLIINGTQYYPLCKDKDFLDGLPFDCVDYLKNGCLAEFFDFGYLTQMPYLSCLSFDSMEFVVKRVRHDLGLHGEFNPKAVFKMFKNLQFLGIGDLRFAPPGVAVDENGNKSKEAENDYKESYYRQTRVGDIYERLAVGWVSNIRKWGVNNVVNWATNRGDKKFPGYAWGIVWRSGMTLGVGVAEGGLKLVGAVAKGISKKVQSALNEV